MSSRVYLGIYQGIVTNINDPEKRGRIKVVCPKVLGSNSESAWCNPISIVAFDNGGDFCLPKINEAVWILFIEGDPNKPVYLGGWWSKNSTPLGENYTQLEDIRIINYADNTIVMKDGTIEIAVKGNTVLKVESNKVIITGDLEVTGNIVSSGTNLTSHKHADSMGGSTSLPR